jgi:tetratricopeptide (TPR) repeat protein
MGEQGDTEAVGRLISEAWAAFGSGRYQEAAVVAGRAVEGAFHLDDQVLLVRALRAEASGLQMDGDFAGALARYTRIVFLAEDPASAGRLDASPVAAEAVAVAYFCWVGCARNLTSTPVKELFRVLDAAEEWLAATGHREWRAAILLERAMVHKRLGQHDAAVSAAEEALTIRERDTRVPGYTLNTHRYQLGDILRAAGRSADAVPRYMAVLAEQGVPSWERRLAHKGLAWCALDAGSLETARREAATAVRLAEPLGDDAMCTSLEVLAEACRADADLDAAWHAAIRYLDAAGRVGGHVRPYEATATAVNIALDRGDLAAVVDLLVKLEQHAAIMDTAAGDSRRTSHAAEIRGRLGSLARDPEAPPEEADAEP